MLVPFVGVVHQHLKAWSLGSVLQCLDRFLEEPAFRRTLMRKPQAFTRRKASILCPSRSRLFSRSVSCKIIHVVLLWPPRKTAGGSPRAPRLIPPRTVEPVTRWLPQDSGRPSSIPRTRSTRGSQMRTYGWVDRSTSSMAPALLSLIRSAIKPTILSPHSKSPAAAFPSCASSPSCPWPLAP